MTDLKSQLIKLGSTNPELRSHIREILAATWDGPSADRDAIRKIEDEAGLPAADLPSESSLMDNPKKYGPLLAKKLKAAEKAKAVIQKAKADYLKVKSASGRTASDDIIDYIVPSRDVWKMIDNAPEHLQSYLMDIHSTLNDRLELRGQEGQALSRFINLVKNPPRDPQMLANQAAKAGIALGIKPDFFF